MVTELAELHWFHWNSMPIDKKKDAHRESNRAHLLLGQCILSSDIPLIKKCILTDSDVNELEETRRRMFFLSSEKDGYI